MTRPISARAISGFVRAVRYSAGTPARLKRARSLVQLSGRNRRRAIMTGTSSRASVSDTRVWQFEVLPSAEAYCGATPTECVPFLGSAVSSITSTASLPPTDINGLDLVRPSLGLIGFLSRAHHLHPATTSGGRSGARLKRMTVLSELLPFMVGKASGDNRDDPTA